MYTSKGLSQSAITYYTAQTFFSDSTCVRADRVLFTPSTVEYSSTTNKFVTCAQDTSGLYYSSEPLIDNIMVFAASALGYDVPFMMESSFYKNSKNLCLTDSNVTAYRTDGVCISMGAYSEVHIITSDLYTTIQYANQACIGAGARSTIESKYWNNNACTSLRKFNTSSAF